MFPSQVRTVIRTLSEQLVFLDGILKELAPGEARYEDVRKARETAAMELTRREQELADLEKSKKEGYQDLLNSFDKARKGAQSISNAASIRIPFNPWSTERLGMGQKISTSRTSKLGSVGDTFAVGDKTFEISSVSRKSLSEISHDYYLDEGAKSPEEFEQVWESLHPGGFKPGQIVYFHQFRELTPDVVELKKLLAKPELTQVESQKAVSLTQKVYKTEARNTLTPEENIALNKQVRKNLADSYSQLYSEGEVKAARVAAYRKRQLEEEYTTLQEIKKRQPIPEAPETPPISPVTDKKFQKNVENFPFVTFEPRPLINYVVKPKEAKVSDFAPEWFGIHDTPDTLPPIVPPTSEERVADWFQFRKSIVSEAREDRRGIVSLPQTVFDTRTTGVPQNIESSLFVKRTPAELEAIKKAEKRADELEVVKEVKEKNLFINMGKPGGKLINDDFYEPRIGEDGTIYYKPVFFRTKEGIIQYAGENPNIMLESRLSQDLNPKTTVEELSFINSNRLEKMMKERGEAYHYEQYDRDIILSNKGLPVKKLDDLKRDEERFKKEFVTYYLVDHPEQLQPWLDKADPKTLKYLNEAWGGIDVVRRQYLPQIEYIARNQKGERVVKSLAIPKTNYDLPDDLVADRALKEKLIQKGLIENAGNRMLSIPSPKSSMGDLLTHEPDESLWIDTGVSTRKIINAVEAETGAKKNTVVYLIEDELPTDPVQYAQLVKDVQSGKKQYITKIGEEIKSETQGVKAPEPGLGMSVSSGILDLLKSQDVPKGIQKLDVKPIENDVQVVRFIPQLNKMAPFKSIEGIRTQALEEIAAEDKALRGADPTAVKGTVIYAIKSPFGNIRQKGTLVTESGTLFDFIEYKGPDASSPILEYHKRYTIPAPTPEQLKAGEKRLTLSLNTNRAVYTPYENYQVTTSGKVTEAYTADDGSKTFQYGYIEDEKGNRVKWTTFKEDNPPALKPGQDYSIYNAWMQAFQEKPKWDPVKNTYLVSPTTGKPEVNINIKPQNIYSKDVLAEGEDTERIKELRDSAYRTVTEAGKPKLFEQTAGSQPKPRAVQPPADPVIATAIENGKPVVITKSGKHIPSEEYLKLQKPVGSSVKVSAVYDDETLSKIEEENPLDDEALFMMGLLPLGAMGLNPGLSPRGMKEEAETAKQASGDRIAAEQSIRMGSSVQADAQPAMRQSAATQTLETLAGTYDVASELAGIWGSKVTESYQRAVERTADYNKEAAEGTMSPYRKYLPIDIGLTALDVVGAALHPLSYPMQAVWGTQTGLGPMEGIRQEVTPSKALNIENPWVGLGADVVLDPLNLLWGAGLVSKISKGEEVVGGLRGLTKGVPEFLGNEEAVLGRRMPSDVDKYIAAADPVEPRQIEVFQPPSPSVEARTPSEPGVTPFSVPETPKVPVVPIEESPVTIKELRQKKILLEKEIEKRGIESPFPWGTVAALGIGAAGIGFGAYSLLEANPQEPVVSAKGNATSYIDPYGKVHDAEILSQIVAKNQTESLNSIINANESKSPGFVVPNAAHPEVYPNITYPVKAPIVGEGQPTTAMGEGAGPVSESSGAKEEKSFLGKVFDVLQTGSYLEGAAITGTQSLLMGNGLEYEWGTTPSEALGLKPKEEGMFDSWTGFFGTALDIAVDPTTYISLGTGTAAKVGTKAGVEIALNPKGLKALQEFTKEAVAKGISKKEAEAMFTETLTNPAIAKRFEPSAGLVLRGWGPLSSHEIELVSKTRLEAAKGMPKEQWDAMLKKMATSGNPSVERAAEYLYDTGAYAGAKVEAIKDKLGTAFTSFYKIKKTVPRPASLPLGESEYAEKFMLFKKGVRYKSDVYFKKYETMREAAKKELGEGYVEIISKYVEAPVLIDSSNLSPKAREIVSVISDDMKVFAKEETDRGLLDSSVDAYLKHILTPEAKEFLAANKKTGTEVFLPLRDSLASSRARGYKGTIEEINTEARKKLGFDFFDPDPFKAAEVRAIESVHATEQYDFLDYVTQYYGEAATASKPGYAFASRTPQLMNVLPQDVAPEMTAVSKGILRKLEPDKVFTSMGGKTYTAKDILKLADDAEIISERTAGQDARDIIEGDAGKKIVTINPSREEIARMALLADRLLNKGMSEKEAVESAAKELKNIRVPEAIAEHLEPKVAKEGILDKTVYTYGEDEYSTLDTYDSLLSKWKWAQTVWAPAYHAQNIIGGFWNAGILGETSPQSFIDSASILGRSDKTLKATIRSARGEERTGAELIEIAGEHGTFGQPGWMDIDKKLDPLSGASTSSKPGLLHIPDVFSGDGAIATMSQKVSESDAGKLLDSWGPAGSARHEENWMRFAVFLDRWKKGDTAEEAAKYSSKYMIEYMPEAYTEFERSYLLRMFPFYKFPRGNIPVQLESLIKQPGKLATLDKVSGRREDTPDWTTGSLVLPGQDPTQFTAIQTPAQQLTWFNDPLIETLAKTSPFIKAPMESVYQSPVAGGEIGIYNHQNLTGTPTRPDPITGLVGTAAYIDPYGKAIPTAPYGASFFNGKPYTSPSEPYTANLGGRIVSTLESAGSDKQPADETVLKLVTSASTNTKSAPGLAELKTQFARAQGRADDFSYEQRFAGWGRDNMVSPLSGISEELQGGHVLPVALGGKAEMSNYLTQTREENYENLAAQTFMTNVPEKEFIQEQFWGDVQDKYTTDIQKNIGTTAEKMNQQGMAVNEAVVEKIAYDAKKKGNLKLYSRELSKIRMQKDWAERMLRTEQRNLEKKKQNPGFKGDPVSERQIVKLDYYIPQYQAKYNEIERLREEERAKEFVLPDQIMRGEDFSFETMDNPIVIRGKGPALAEPDKIADIVKYEDLAFDRAYILEYAPVIDLKRWLGVNKSLMDEKIYGKDALKQPDSKEWKDLQAKAIQEDTDIFGAALPAPVDNPITGTQEAPEGFVQKYLAGAKPALTGTASVPTVPDTTGAPLKWVLNNTATGNMTRPTFEQIFGVDLDDFQNRSTRSPPVARLNASDLPLRGSGIPTPYTLSGWNARLQSDREDLRSKYAQIQSSAGAGGLDAGDGGVVTQELDLNNFLESAEFVSAVETIATRLYDDQVYS